MKCSWGHDDCINQDSKCYLCFMDDQYYKQPAIKEPKKAKETKRKGSKFEAVNSNRNNQVLLGGSSQTPNSGAGKIKGDEQISGLINIMEELKEQNSTNAKGEKTFTIHKEWLDKLKREAMAEHKEFWYLKFCFCTRDALDFIHYVIIDADQLMSMIKTMWEDRKKAKLAQNEIDVYRTRYEAIEAENVALKAKIAALEAQIRFENKNI